MGKIIKFDEDGFPIPDKVKVPKQSVEFDEDGLPIPVKKKVSSPYSNIGGQASATSSQTYQKAAAALGGKVPSQSSSVAPSSVPVYKTKLQEMMEADRKKNANAILDYAYSLKTPEQKKQAQDTPELAQKRGYAAGQQRLSKYVESGSTDPLKDIRTDANNKQGAPDVVNDILAVKTLEDLTSGYDAKNIISEGRFGGDTKSLLENKAAKYDKNTAAIKQSLSDVEGWSGKSYSDINTNEVDDGFIDMTYTPRMKDAAVRYMASNNELFGKQLQAAGIDLNEAGVSGKLDSGTMGRIMNEYLNDEDVQTYFTQEKPQLYKALKRSYETVITDNPQYGINVVANEISRKRQKDGLNNPIVTFDDKNFKEGTDLVAQELYANDPVKMDIYNKYIKENPDKYIDTPSLLEGIAHGAEGVYKGLGSTVTAPFKSIPTQIKDSWKKEASHVSADPEGISKFLSGTGHVLGLVGALGGLGNVAGAGGAGTYSTKVVPLLTGTVPFAGDFWQEGIMKYPDSPVKAATSATLNTALYGALSQKIFPTKQVQELFGKIKPDINKIVEKLSSGSITREAARQEANTLLKKGFDVLGGAVTKSAKISAELTGIQAANRVFDKLFMDNEEFEQFHPDDELTDSFKTLFLDNLVLGGMTKYSEMRRGNKIVEESLYEAATNPKMYNRLIEDAFVKDPSINKDNMAANLDYIANIKKELDARGISEPNQKRFLFEALKERALEEQKPKTPESSLLRKHDENIRQGQEVKDKILSGEDVVGNELSENEIKAIEALKGKEFEVLKPYTDVLQNENSTGAEKREALKGISDQLLATSSAERAGTELGQKLSTLIEEIGYEAPVESEALKSILAPETNQGEASTVPTVTKEQDGETGNESVIKEGFTDGKDLNRIFNQLKSKYGDKKGSALYEVANRLVNPNKNTIVEIRGNGVVVKENGKYILKPFGNTDANSKKWTLYKGIDVTPQFEPQSQPTVTTKEQTPSTATEQTKEEQLTKTENNETEQQPATAKQNQSIGDNPQAPIEEESPKRQEKLNERYDRVMRDVDLTDPYDIVLDHFGNKGKINPSEIELMFGGKDKRIHWNTSVEWEKRARISLLGKDAPTIKELAHTLWESDPTGNHTTEDYENAIEEVLRNYNSKSSMKQALVEKYDLEAAYEKYAQQQMGKEAIDIVENLSEAEINEILRLDSDEKLQSELELYLDGLPKSKSETRKRKLTEERDMSVKNALKPSLPPIAGKNDIAKITNEDALDKAEEIRKSYNKLKEIIGCIWGTN